MGRVVLYTMRRWLSVIGLIKFSYILCITAQISAPKTKKKTGAVIPFVVVGCCISITIHGLTKLNLRLAIFSSKALILVESVEEANNRSLAVNMYIENEPARKRGLKSVLYHVFNKLTPAFYACVLFRMINMS